MSERFSIRTGEQQLNNQKKCSKPLRSRIWNIFAERHVKTYTMNRMYSDIVENTLFQFGQDVQQNTNVFDHSENIKTLKCFIIERCKWYEVYDFIEFYLKKQHRQAIVDFEIDELSLNKYEALVKEFNEVLEDEKTGYHLIKGMVVPITNSLEIDEIEKALTKSPNHIAISIEKAIRLYSNKIAPDCNNAIKEIINAVESLCRTIAKDFGAKTGTLGEALKYITMPDKETGSPKIYLHPSLKLAIEKLYGFTSDEGGIRHGDTSYTNEEIEDARFMIVTCSAIINFLMVKWEKAKEAKDV